MAEHNSVDYAALQDHAETRLRIETLQQGLDARAPGSSARILEVGLGPGDVTIMLAAAFANVTSVDASETQIDLVAGRLAERGFANVELVCSTVEEFAPAPKAYDGIVLMNIIEHLKDPVAILRHLAPALRDGAAMHITVPLAASVHRWLGVELGFIDDVHELAESDIAYGHYHVYTPDTLRGHVEAAGLRVDQERPMYFKPLTTEMLAPLPMETHRALDALARRFPEFASYMYMEAVPASR